MRADLFTVVEDVPEWDLVLRKGAETQEHRGITHMQMVTLLLVPLGPAINHGTRATWEIYRGGELRARLETFAPGWRRSRPQSATPG